MQTAFPSGLCRERGGTWQGEVVKREERKESRLPSLPWFVSAAKEGVKKGDRRGREAWLGLGEFSPCRGTALGAASPSRGTRGLQTGEAWD